MEEIPHPFSLLCELTYRCPLQCPYCSNPIDFARHAGELETDDWKRVLSEAAELGVVQAHFSGGEPLLRRDVPEIVGHARKLGLFTNLSTGGTLLDEKLVERLRAAGLDSLQVSIQDADPKNSNHFAGGVPSFEKKIRAAHWVIKAGLPLTINVVLHRQNIDHINAIITMAEELGATRLELANTQFNGWALKNRRLLLPAREQVENAADVAQAARQRLKGRMEIFYVLPDYYGKFPKPCLYGWGRVFLTVAADGMVMPCQTAREIRGLKFENIRYRSLAEIWFDSEVFNKFRGTDWLPEPCQSCPQREKDFGGCRCQAFLLTGDAFATDPVCSLALRHDVVVQALTEVKTSSSEELIYRNRKESLRLTSADSVTRFQKGITAFTLVELLVVMAIIGILAALLFPVLARARQKGQQASCVNNARQQTLAVFMYADENSDVLPPVAYNDQNGNEVDWPTLLNPYLNSLNIHLCPNDLLSKLNSYGLNELGFVDLTDPGVTTPNRLMQFHTPTTTIMLGDVGTENDFTTPRPDTFKMIAPGSVINDDGDARPSNRHAGRCDLGFIDGHAEPMQLWQFYTNQVPTNKWFTP